MTTEALISGLAEQIHSCKKKMRGMKKAFTLYLRLLRANSSRPYLAFVQGGFRLHSSLLRGRKQYYSTPTNDSKAGRVGVLALMRGLSIWTLSMVGGFEVSVHHKSQRLFWVRGQSTYIDR